MNTNLKIKNIVAKILFAAVILVAPTHNISAQESSDEFGVWGTFEFSKKVNKKTKFVIDAEVRSVEAVSNLERIAVGGKLDYKIKEWKELDKLGSQIELKANVGYSFIYGHYLSEKSLKDDVEEDLRQYNYNIDDAYWAARNRVYLTLTGEFKVGRFEISLRERLQYTHTGSATTTETKYRREEIIDIKGEHIGWNDEIKGPEPEFKEAKENLSLRSRFSVKYDIPNCKINPFASAELYTRLDKWQLFDKARYRAGATYKINKKNSVSLYYLYQDVNGNDPDGHAVGFEYSIDL
ncbi:MAG: DUF2490 domain-containing protein [Bacteroidaceae bacterium]|nr:DUF2490 domain-containing protein [Bacteroidaceae bacterium]